MDTHLDLELGQRLEFAFTHTGTSGESYFSFVSGQCTVDGDMHQTAFLLGAPKAIDDCAAPRSLPRTCARG